MKLINASLVSILFFFAGTAMAADYPDMKAGLWEHNVELKTDTGELERKLAEAKKQMEEQMKNMPPAQRKMMEDMLADSGMDMEFGNIKHKMCVTEEQVREADFDFSDDDCEQKIISQSSSNIEIEFSCAGDSNMGKGRGEIQFHSDEHYTGEFEFNTEMNGQATELTMNQDGRWLGSDCGAVSPEGV